MATEAPWAYPDDVEDVVSDEPAPTWACPDKRCECGPTAAEPKKIQHTLHLYDEEARPMAGARARVIQNGRVMNLDAPNAGGDGTLEVSLPEGSTMLRVDWAPPDMPQEPRYPFQKIYHLALAQEPREATFQRMHNLGFAAFPDPEDNVRDFQRRYKRTLSGAWEDIAGDVREFHDDGKLPPFDSAAPTLAKGAPDDSKKVAPEPTKKGADPTGAAQGKPTQPGAGPSGGARPTTTAVLTIQLEVATPLRTEPNKFIERVAGATIKFDVSLLTPKVAAPPDATTDADGVAVLTMPANVSGQITLDITAPDKWQNKGNKPADPSLTDALRPIGEADLAAVPNRAKLHKQRNDAELARDKAALELTDLRLHKGSAADIKAKKDEVEKQDKEIETARAAINALNHDANVAWAKNVPEYLFRKFSIPVFMRSGALTLRASNFKLGDPPFVGVVQTPTKITCKWIPDWVRAPAFRFGWQRPPAESGVVDAKRPFGKPCLVLHATGGFQGRDMTLAEGVATFTANILSAKSSKTRDTGLDTSIHYLVDRFGHVVKIVDEQYAAFHADPAIWERGRRMNVRSVGIEMLNKGVGQDYTKAQLDTVHRLVGDICKRYGIQKRRVIGHGEIAFNGTSFLVHTDRIEGDPGRRFDWVGLAKAGLTFERFANVPAAGTKNTKATAAQILAVKQKLLTLGYSMSSDNRAPADLDNKHDTGLARVLELVFFRTTEKVADKPAGPVQSIDGPTADAIVAGVDKVLAAEP